MPSPRPRPASGRPAARRRRSAIVVLAFLAAALVGVGVAVQRPSVGAEVLVSDGSTAQPPVPSDTSPTPSASPSPSPEPTTPAPVLALPGPVPTQGRGSFAYDSRPGPVLGRAGAVRRFRVAVENGSGQDVHAFGDAVQRALAGPGSWVDGGSVRLRRVAPGEGYDFTVYLATRVTAGRLCGNGGIDIRKGGVPYTSCRVPGKVVINLDRWQTSAPHLVAAGMPLETYRLYVINHEVGHQLGHHHEGCPAVGRPAPVMQQQTLFLGGCRANPWPYLNGKRYTGPPTWKP
ncbi:MULTISPECIES: DUF3152 domain-containing protein [Micromonospora]|uniref:DUF3152 domain-containing protein n=1 Tax=Micromonospora solifontis TaxID=2487138 RepID=A0ABX9W9W9_9ACTN|nr:MULTISPECIES: DUF3152 domain-containing protein [Micromonospora]NES12545.1 DUF3152 domain-containing protein [Micromonospora sp. PPF5-17B]NES39170.1 DUF3152 domain-containing protein [Micromonospora solifontis]NES54570.1 DUF3152 domain-containing protein [Micromonospora sp. PPF5-6]RNL90359.1 DUF3152 domain-containing protein [Micromonospora solifontis]